MKLFYQVFGLILGFIIGILTCVTSVAVFFLWVYSDARKSTPIKSKFDSRKHKNFAAAHNRDNPLTHKYATRDEAEETLRTLKELISEVGYATLADLKVWLGMSVSDEDRNKVWRSLDGTPVVPYVGEDHFVIVFPALRVL